jgi:hypothetical protein
MSSFIRRLNQSLTSLAVLASALGLRQEVGLILLSIPLLGSLVTFYMLRVGSKERKRRK